MAATQQIQVPANQVGQAGQAKHPLFSRNNCCTLVAALLMFCGLWYAEDTFNPYTIQILNLIAINIILALSLNLIYGFTGMFSLGHAGFMAVGAYVCSLLVLSPLQKELMWILEPIIWPFSVMELPFFAAVIAGGLVAAFIGLLVSMPVLRLGGDYLGIATLGFAEIIRVVITNVTPITNGSLGIKGIPKHSTLLWNYVWLFITLYFIISLLRSNSGNVLKAIRDDKIAARTMGINIFRQQALSFSLGAFFAGVGGGLLACLISTIDPKMFTFLLTFNILMIAVAGGLGSVTGSVLAGIIITVLLEWLRFVEEGMDLGFAFIPGVPGMRMVIFSMALMAIILFRSSGIMGMREFSWDAVFGAFSKIRKLFGQGHTEKNLPKTSPETSPDTSPEAVPEAAPASAPKAAPEATTGATAAAAPAQLLPDAPPLPDKPVLLLSNITMRFGGVTAVHKLDISIPQGSIMGLIGPNGAGKTTVFNVISGFYKPTHGQVLLAGENITGLSPHLVCKKGIARTFQNIRLFQTATALQNVMTGFHVRQKSQWWMPALQLPLTRREEHKQKEMAYALLNRLGLGQHSQAISGSLPYGAQRRLEIARALATRPAFLLLDEPAAGMNPYESQELMGLIREIRKDFALTILLIEHDMKVVMGVCSSIYVLEYGLCIAQGTPDEIRNNPRVIEAYLGEDYLHHA
jgi:branched-chain amino acid transport system permease protein